jgi:hypothetical protein
MGVGQMSAAVGGGAGEEVALPLSAALHPGSIGGLGDGKIQSHVLVAAVVQRRWWRKRRWWRQRRQW